MRLLLSLSDPGGGLRDVAVDCDDDTTVGDLARHLAAAVGHAGQRRGAGGDGGAQWGASAPGSPPPAVRSTGRRFGVVDGGAGSHPTSVPADAEPRTFPVMASAVPVPVAPAEPPDEPPDLWVGADQVDPRMAVAESPLRHGVVVGLGGPATVSVAEPSGTVEVRVVGGPGAGTVRRLGPGTHRVGTGPECSVRLPSGPSVDIEVSVVGDVTVRPVAPPEEAGAPVRTVLLDGPIVVPRRDVRPGARVTGKDAGKDQGKDQGKDLGKEAADFVSLDPADPRHDVELDRLALADPTDWEPGVLLTVGDSLLAVHRPTAPDASLSPNPLGASMDYNRPPRLLPPPRATEFSLPREPVKPTKGALPWLMMLAPLVMGAGMYVMTQNPRTLLFIALSPLMMVGNWLQGRRSQGKRHREQLADYREKKARIEAAAFEALLTERAARRRDAPDPAELLLQATGPRSRLWERRPTDPDWLVVRVGLADLPSDVILSDPDRERHLGALSWTAPDVPVTVGLGEAGVTGVAGPGDLPRQVATWITAQVAALHSPADLQMVVLGEPEEWAWVRWLPHVRTDAEPLALVGTDEETVSRRVADLVALLDARREAASSGSGGGRPAPILVVLDGSRALRLLPGMVGLLRDGPALGFVFLCLDADVRLLPEECRVVVRPQGDGLRVEATGRRVVEAVRADLVPPGWCERIGRALSAVRDVSAVGAASTIPTQSRLLAVLGLDPPTPDAVARGWAAGGRTTRAVIGEGADGLFSVDLRADGPHGLVAGTTGSGKSELLQTLVASLAVGNRPDEMTFVLVDYKGGAAFQDCARLPHTVGMVTDLDGHLTTRALESLGAELRRREHVLADARAKDIDDYLARRGPGDLPLPRLLIVIDEFAALVAELPDFVTGLVDIARRGRSLGVHLLLATQRPAGVVTAEIKSNTNLRIALRVTDSGDSQDVVESDASAHIPPSLPGRAYARLGHSQLIAFQSSRVGGRPRGAAPASVRIRPLEWASIGRPAPVAKAAEAPADTPTDLAHLVTAVVDATRVSGIEPQPSPWLPPLPEQVVLDDVLADDAEPRRGLVPPLPLGLADQPTEQKQEVLEWDLAGGSHLAIGGQTRAGRSSALRLVAGGIARLHSPYDVHLYGLDCGNGALLPLVGMPHTGAVVTRDQPDRVRRLLALIGGEVARRQQVLAAGGYADIAEQRSANPPDLRLPYLVLLVDRWEGFVGAFEQSDGGVLIEQLVTLMREGAAVGLRVVVAGDRSMLVGRVGAALEDRLLLRMASPDDFSYIGMRARDVPNRMPPGRAFRGGERPVEVQLALLAADAAGTAQVAELQRLAVQARDAAGHVPAARRPGRVDELPVIATPEDVARLREEEPPRTELLVGIGGDTLAVRGIDVDRDGPGLLVVGPQRSGRSSTLLATAVDALARGWRVTVVTPRRSPLRDLDGVRGVRAVLTGEATPDELRAALDSPGPRLLVVDDFEVLGAEHALATVAEEYLKSIRDSGDAIAVACGVDEVSSMYRGAAATLRKGRSGVLLAPRSAADGDVFSTRLPRSIGAAVPAGRAILVRGGSWEWVQVPRPTVPDDR